MFSIKDKSNEKALHAAKIHLQNKIKKKKHFLLLQYNIDKMGIPQPTERHATTLGRTKNTTSRSSRAPRTPKSSRFHFTKFWRERKRIEQKVSSLLQKNYNSQSVVCVCVRVGVGASPNGFIAPMKRPEKPNKSETRRRTKATERAWSLLLLHRFVIGYILTGNICKEEGQDPRVLWTRRCPVWKGHLRVSEGFRKWIEILVFYIFSL